MSLSFASVSSLSPSHGADSIAFVDAGLDNVEGLIQGLENPNVVLLDAQQSGIEQITLALAQYSGLTDDLNDDMNDDMNGSLSSVHIFSHGSAGALQLGASVLNSSSLNAFSEHLQQWGRSLSPDADLLFYGCNMAAGEQGMALTRRLSELTGADVAASHDLTGLGGDWQLEVNIGEVESAIALNPTAQLNYASTLAASRLNSPNRLSNGDFEAGLASWSPYTGSESVTTTESFTGRASLQLSAAGSGVQQFLDTITVGDTYTVTGHAKTSSEGFAGVGINFFDADYTFLAGTSERISTRDWSPYELTGEAPAGSRYLQIWAYKDDGNGDFWIDNMALIQDGAANELPGDAPAAPLRITDELLPNPGFESGLDRWNRWTGTEQVSSVESFAGDRSLELAAPASGVHQFLSATSGQTYTFSGYGKSASDRFVGMGLNFFDADYNLLSGGVSSRINTPDWQQYNNTATAPDGTRYLQVWAYKHGETGSAFVDALSLSTAAESRPESRPEPADITAPTATLSASDLTTTGSSTYDFTVTYTDETAVDTATFNSRDIRVFGPDSFTQLATFAGNNSERSNGSPRAVTYRLTAPGGEWDGDDNGLYSVFLEAGQVSDTEGNSAAISASLGDFMVDLPSDILPLGSLDRGVAVSDDATGLGYLMYSEELLPVRFLGNGPEAGNASNLIAVQYENSQWYYDNNSELVAFTPRRSDRLLAELDFDDDTALLLAGTRRTINGIESGYAAGDLAIAPNQWDGSANPGEFGITGTQVTLYTNSSRVPGQLSLSSSVVRVDEADGTATLTVNRLGGSDGTLSVRYTTTAASAIAGEDFTARSGQLTFGDGQTQQTISIPLLDDTIGEAAEAFSVSLNNVTEGASIGRGAAIVTINENDEGITVENDSDTGRTGDLLPDLLPIASTSGDYSIDTREIPGQVLLRLATEVANVGEGPLEVWGVDTTGATQSVFQRIYHQDGSSRDTLAGEFVNYTSHGHFHFEGFATYNLRQKNMDDSVGAIVGSGGKTSFCLVNINQPFPELTDSAVIADGRGGDDCGFIQGIDVGYADVYPRSLPNQWVDVTNVPSGEYWLEITTDPDNNILESDESNNTAYVAVNLENPRFA